MAISNAEAIQIAAKKVNFITEHGNKDQVLALQNLLFDAERIAAFIYNLPVGTDVSSFEPVQAEQMARLDAIVAEVASKN